MGGKIIRMYEMGSEEGKHTQVVRMQTGCEGGRPGEGKRTRTEARLFGKLSDEVVFYRIARGGAT